MLSIGTFTSCATIAPIALMLMLGPAYLLWLDRVTLVTVKVAIS